MRVDGCRLGDRCAVDVCSTEWASLTTRPALLHFNLFSSIDLVFLCEILLPTRNAPIGACATNVSFYFVRQYVGSVPAHQCDNVTTLQKEASFTDRAQYGKWDPSVLLSHYFL